MRRHRVEQAEIDQPFADKTVERRQTGNGHRAEREQARRPRHRAPESAEPAHFARAGGVQHRTGAEEQKRFEQPVIPHMQQRAGQREPAPRGIAVRRGDHREAEADEDDADVFDAVIREQPFEIVLRQARTRRRARALTTPSAATTQPAASGTGSQPLKRTMP